MRAFLNVSIPVDAAPSALPHLVRFAAWVNDPANSASVYAALYRRWAAWSEDPHALEVLAAITPPESRT